MLRAVAFVLAEAATERVGIDRVVLRGAEVVLRIEARALTDPLARALAAAKAVAEASDNAQIATPRVKGLSLRVFMRYLLAREYVRLVLPANTMKRIFRHRWRGACPQRIHRGSVTSAGSKRYDPDSGESIASAIHSPTPPCPASNLSGHLRNNRHTTRLRSRRYRIALTRGKGRTRVLEEPAVRAALVCAMLRKLRLSLHRTKRRLNWHRSNAVPCDVRPLN